MRVGKREQIVLVSIGALLSIFLIHQMIFQPRAEAFARVKSEYDDGKNKLNGDAIPDSDAPIKAYAAKTKEYDDSLTSLAVQLNVDMPARYNSKKPEAIEQCLQETIALVKKLVELRQTVKQPQLSFLDDRRKNPADPYSMQEGWNIPAKLPEAGSQVQGAVWDNVVKLCYRWDFMNNTSNPSGKIAQRAFYNELLQRLYINPMEVSDWVVPMPPSGVVFFNDPKLAKAYTMGVQEPRNQWSTNRYGVLIPSLKKLWMSELLWNKKDQSSDITRERLRNVLEVNLTTDYPLFCLNQQLKALVDIVQLAQQDGIVEIWQVNLMKPVGIAKAGSRTAAGGAAGAAPTPAPTPKPAAAADPNAGDPTLGDPTLAGGGGGAAVPGAPPGTGGAGLLGAPAGTTLINMGPPEDQKIGGGSGIEIWFRGSNANVMKFLFDITHMPRTYAVDDLGISTLPDGSGMLSTSATIEMVLQTKAAQAPK